VDLLADAVNSTVLFPVPDADERVSQDSDEVTVQDLVVVIVEVTIPPGGPMSTA
jgi:hypothetical protein